MATQQAAGTDNKPGKQEQNRLLHFQDCAAAVDQLFQEALKSQGISAFDKFWDFTRQFNHLSIFNAMLVMVQRPGATAVGTRKQWEKIGRFVQPDAVPIIILRPFGPVLFIFELGDTEGEPVPAENMSTLFATGVVLEKLWDYTIESAKQNNIVIEESSQQGMSLAGTAARLTDFPSPITGNKERRFRIKLNIHHNLPSRFATLTHELGHIYCGHIGADSKGRWPNRNNLTNATCELEAEAVAWLVCQRNGITTRSKDYLSSLIDEADQQKVSMYAIFDAANRVEARSKPRKKKDTVKGS